MQKPITQIVGISLLGLILTGLILPGVYRGQDPTCWTTRVTRYVQHTVDSEDTIDRIARLYGTTVQKILAKNDMIPGDMLLPGEKLVIPVSGYKAKLIL